jgi:hypothetical protein
MNINDIKKELYKSKVNAKFTHYLSGNLFYAVELSDGTYQFPIATTEKVEVRIYEGDPELLHRAGETEIFRFEKSNLSKDLGITTFFAEIKASELSRWIGKAVEKGEFIKIKSNEEQVRA